MSTRRPVGGRPDDISTLHGLGGGTASGMLMPLVEATCAHAFAAERIHMDDTPCRCRRRAKGLGGYVPTLATTARLFAGILSSSRRHPPYRIADVVGDEQRASLVDGNPDRSAVRLHQVLSVKHG
jgi:hypothetical protein